MHTENRLAHSRTETGLIGERNIIFLIKPKTSVEYLYNQYTLAQGLEKMRYHGYTAMPVITEDGSYAGTVSEGDFLWHVLACREMKEPEGVETLVEDILRDGWNPPVKISASLDEVLLRVMDQNFVPVIDDREKFMGIITRRDIIRHYYTVLKTGRD